MNDALGEPQSVLVLGGTSEIALATVKALPRARIRRVVLAGRPSTARDEAVADLTAAGIAGVAGSAAVGAAAKAMTSTAVFLKEQGRIQEVKPDYSAFITDAYIKKAMAK